MSRKIDALIAGHVFKKTIEYCLTMPKNPVGMCDMSREHVPYNFEDIRHYSTDIAAAWQVVDCCGPLFALSRHEDAGGTFWECTIEVNDSLVLADTAPMAICLAALKAKGVEVKE